MSIGRKIPRRTKLTVERNDYNVLPHFLCNTDMLVSPNNSFEKGSKQTMGKKQKIQLFTRLIDLLADRHLIHLSPCRLLYQMWCELQAEWMTIEKDVGHSVDQSSNSGTNRLSRLFTT
ncbi:hypothetical protein AVEN_172273-1 [Araneus ventricosus]|uniref:Uncharacterized protein n=1 Tax=Araneus ventricosus TaxID=182803 RepID=A0A4Y2U7U8_ARAVE|nr:hypothetical protein AVEN_172273-1 [Araneus ventricosus]